MLDAGGVEAGFFPGLAQAQVHADHRVRKDLREEVINVPKLRRHVGLLVIDFAGSPETFERDLDLLPDRTLFGDGPHVILATDEELINLAMDLEDRGALGFGRVGGEHGLDAHAVEALGDLLVGQAGLTEGAERTTPRTRIGSETMLIFAETLGLRGSIFFHHVEELEGD